MKMAGDPSFPARFAFIEFQTDDMALYACNYNGTELAGKVLKVSLSKQAIASPYTPKQQNPYNQFPFVQIHLD